MDEPDIYVVGSRPEMPPLLTRTAATLGRHGHLALLLLPATALAAPSDCPRPVDTSEVVQMVAATESAFAMGDPSAPASIAIVEGRVSCSVDVLDPSIEARVHVVEALGAYAAGDAARVPQALAGAFSAAPGFQLPTTLIPADHPIRSQVEPAMRLLRDDPGVELPVLDSGWVEADGQHALRLPAQRASLAQQLDGNGEVVASHYRWPDEVGHEWIVLQPPVQARSDREAHTSASPWARRAPLLVASGASLVTSAVLLALAADGRAEFDATEPLAAGASDTERGAYSEQLLGMQASTNTLTYGSYATLAVGVGLGATAVITW